MTVGLQTHIRLGLCSFGEGFLFNLYLAPARNIVVDRGRVTHWSQAQAVFAFTTRQARGIGMLSDAGISFLIVVAVTRRLGLGE
jgi:hypothetical protein